MATGTKARGWPLMANCILHSSFVNCCLPSSHFLLGHGTKPRTGGIRNGTSAPPTHRRALSTSFSPSLSFSLLLSLSLFLPLSLPRSPRSRASFYLLLTVVHSRDLADSVLPFLPRPDMSTSPLQSYFPDVLSAATEARCADAFQKCFRK